MSSQLFERESKVKISVVCPVWVQIRILETDRNRPVGLGSDLDAAGRRETEAIRTEVWAALEAGFSPEFVAEKIFDGIRHSA